MNRILIVVVVALSTVVSARAADDSIRSGTFDSAGVSIAYVEAGSGEPVVLIHGLHSSARMNWIMPGTFGKLAAKYHVIALDLRGHGVSGKPTEEAAYGQPMADDIKRLLDHLQIKQAHLVGYSLGGIIAMKFTIDHPTRVRSTTLGGMGWLRDGSFQQTMFERMGDRASASQTPPACVHGMARLAVNESQIKQVKTPLEMIVGDRDPCRRMYVEPAAAVRSDWPVVVIEGAGHLSCVMTPQFQNEIVRWLGANQK